jgi:hypothetical protein
VKKLRFSRAALSLIAPFVILSCLFFGFLTHLPARKTQAANSTPTPGPKSANVQVGFITTITGQPPSGFQNVYLNVVAVRLNPKPKPGAKNQGIPGENDPGWESIPVPTGIGVGLAGKPGDLQIDMIAGQGKLQTFNTGAIRPNRYSSVEVLLDSSNIGSIVPVCTSGGGSLEGCIAYPMVQQVAGSQISFVSPSQIVTAKNTLTQLALQLQLQIVSKPTSIGAPYVVNIVAAPAPNNASQFLATVTGTVTGAQGNATVKHVRHLSVTAEIAGTNTIVASSDVVDGQYTLFLPAAADLGTLYDFFVSGGEATYAAARGVPGSSGGLIFPAQTYTLNFNVQGDQQVGTIGGQVRDACTNRPIAGATVQMLMPPEGSSANCLTSPSDCVSIGFTTTDNNGRYPLPGTSRQPAFFNNVPTGQTFVVEASAAGYDTQLFQAQASGSNEGTHGGTCQGTFDAPACDVNLTTGYISGTVNLTAAPPNSNSVNVQVFAEQAGTDDLVSALVSPIQFRAGQQSATFSLNVPTQIASFDLFATAADLYGGVTDPYPGHSIITQSAVAGPPAACSTAAANFAEAMDCTGHASISGTATNPDSGTTIELSKNNVKLMQAAVGPATPAPSVGNTYSFCVPPDSYSLQRLEQGVPVPGASASIAALPTPVPTSTPCPTTCFNADNVTCPGLCGTTIVPPL